MTPPFEPSHITWRIKPTAFCNLRCRYCYEWNRLDDPQRLSLSQWRTVLQTAAELRLHRPVPIHIVIQGGEPLLLPLDYLRDAVSLCREILGGATPVGLLTNLTIARPETLAWIVRDRIDLGVSFDGASSPRLDLAARPVHELVLANMAALTQLGIPFGVNLVLGTHNHNRLPGIHDQLVSLDARWLSVIPMFESPAPDCTSLMLTPPQVDLALSRLYDHWDANGRQIPISPFTRCLRALDLGTPLYSLPTPAAFTVHPDATIQPGTADTTSAGVHLSRLLEYIRSKSPAWTSGWTELDLDLAPLTPSP